MKLTKTDKRHKMRYNYKTLPIGRFGVCVETPSDCEEYLGEIVIKTHNDDCITVGVNDKEEIGTESSNSDFIYALVNIEEIIFSEV